MTWSNTAFETCELFFPPLFLFSASLDWSSVQVWRCVYFSVGKDKVEIRPSFSPFLPLVHVHCMWSKENMHTAAGENTGWSSRVPAGSRGLPRHAVKAPLIPVLQPDRPCIARCCFIVTKVGDITPCQWLWLVWMRRCRRLYRCKRNIRHTRARNPGYFRFHCWIDLGLSGEFKMWHLHSASALLFQQAQKKIRKVKAAGGW